MNTNLVSLILAGALVIAASADATIMTYDTSSIEYSAGTGDNSATIVIDFDENNYFLFEFNWADGADHTGWDALTALDTEINVAGSDLDISAIDYGGGWFVTDFAYTGGQKFDYVGVFDDINPIDTGWGYHGSTDNLNWAFNAPVADRVLTDGDFDSWVWTNSAPEGGSPYWGYQFRGPGETPVPEPVTIALFGFGGLIVLNKKRRSGRGK